MPPTVPAGVRPTAPPRAFLSETDLHGATQQRWGSNLTPLAVSAAHRSADAGYMTPLADLLDEIRATDPHVQAILSKREWMVAGAEWEVRPARTFAGGKESAEAATIRRFVSAVLTALPAFSDALSHLMSAVYYGRAVMEVTWAVEGRWYVPRVLLPVHPRWVHYDHRWRLHLWAEGTPGNGDPFGAWPGLDLTAYPAGQFLIHTPRIRGGFASQEGLGRPISWFAMFKRWVIRDAMGLAELAGRMARVGTYSTGAGNTPAASEEDKQRLEAALQNWSSSRALIHPETTKVQFVPPVKGDTIHGPLIALFNSELSKAVLGETLTTEAGEKGARSLGEVHAAQGRMIARYDARSLEETITNYLIAPLVRLNFGPSAPVPVFALAVDPQESLDALAGRVEKLVKVGLRVGQAWTRNQFGIEDPVEGEPLLGVTVEAIPASVASVPENALGGDGAPPADAAAAPQEPADKTPEKGPKEPA